MGMGMGMGMRMVMPMAMGMEKEKGLRIGCSCHKCCERLNALIKDMCGVRNIIDALSCFVLSRKDLPLFEANVLAKGKTVEYFTYIVVIGVVVVRKVPQAALFVQASKGGGVQAREGKGTT